MSRLTPLVLAVVLAVVVLSSVGSAIAAERYELVLADRTYLPAEIKLARSEDSHLVVQFYEIPTEAQRAELERAGITLLDYLPNYAWTASVRGGAVQSVEPGMLRAVFALRPEDKVSATAFGQRVVRAFVYDDVESPESVLSGYGDILDVDRASYTLRLTGDLTALASEDIVKFVMGPRPEKAENVDEIRANMKANEVQAAPYNLSGLGLTVGMWDNGSAATNHDDYNDRLTVGDGASTGTHPAQVCGIMAGDGTRSTAYGGSPNQWRGVATQVDIASYSWPDDLSNMDDEHSDAISNYDIILSQNSWGWGLCPSYCEYYGEYDDWSQNYDRLVRGSQGKKLTVVFSAGNDGDCSQCSGSMPDYPYGTIPGPGSTCKNAIVVGSNDADDDGLSSYSSRGPTADGRLKPDIAAPGCKSYQAITTTYTSNNYISSYCGTSFSAPAVSGCVALLMEDYTGRFGGEAWPSTVKALLIQGAEDQGNPGPDFSFGYGRVNIQNTVDIVREDDGENDLIKEDTLSPSETWEYEISVTGGGPIKVTLAWDDYEGNFSGGGLMLVNDLDLELEAPSGTIYRPWVLDPDNPSLDATTGADHRNNVEQVEVASPMPGTWTIRVTATVMPEPNQDFSVVTNFGGAAPDLPPNPPTGLDAVPGTGEGEVDVSWNANSEPDLDHYRLERDVSAAFISPTSFVTASTSFGDSGLTPGDTYYYRVFAVDAGGNESSQSNTDLALATDLSPAVPTGLDAVAGAGEGEIDVTWSANPEPDFDHYRLERCTDPGFGPGTDPFDCPVAEFHDSGLTPGETYHYRVFAVDAGGNESDPSGADSAVATDIAPAAPTGLDAVGGPSEGEIDVAWNASGEPDFDHYRLERCTDPGFGPGTDPFDLPEPAYHDSGLTPGETYHYRVFAVDAGGNESDPSGADSAVATDLAPVAPTGLDALAGAGEGEIDVAWNASGEPDFDHYRLERCTDPGFGPGTDPFDCPVAEFHDSALIPGDTYYYRAIAVDAGGNESAPSIADSAVATDLPPAAPSALVAEQGATEEDVSLHWSANGEDDFDHYRVERDTSDAFGPATLSVETIETSYMDESLEPDTYFYRVIAVDVGSNESTPSDTVSVTLEQTGVGEELTAGVSFIRPNPFSAETTIRYTVPADGASVTLKLYDIRGRLVRTLVEQTKAGGAYEAVWDGSDRTGRVVASGVYFARVQIGDWNETRKIAYVR